MEMQHLVVEQPGTRIWVRVVLAIIQIEKSPNYYDIFLIQSQRVLKSTYNIQLSLHTSHGVTTPLHVLELSGVSAPDSKFSTKWRQQ